MSTFNDGSGQERDATGSTRLGWRDIERVAAVMLAGEGGENKQIFDVLVPDLDNPSKLYGISVKSKELSRKSALGDLGGSGRVYMELCNSPAKLWEPLKAAGITEADFSAGLHAEAIGTQILKTVSDWHSAYAAEFSATNPQKTIDLHQSIYLTISYNKASSVRNRQYQLHSFSLDFPQGVIWRYSSSRCLRGFDPMHPDEVLFDWYGLSGGQLKYYPRAAYSKYASPVFQLLEPRKLALEEKAARYFPESWQQAEGRIDITTDQISDEIHRLAKLIQEQSASTLLLEAAQRLRNLK